MTEFDEGYHSTRLKFDERRLKVWRPLVEYLQRWVPKNGVVVDVGCAHADFLRFITAKRRIGVDLFKHKTFPKNSEFLKIPVWDIHKKIKNADVVFASNLFEHLDDDQLKKSFASIRKALKKGGKLIILQPNFKYAYKEYFDDYTHKKMFTEVSLPDLLRVNGFSIAEVFPEFLPYSMKSRLPTSSFLVWLYLRLPFKPMAGQMLIIAQR